MGIGQGLPGDVRSGSEFKEFRHEYREGSNAEDSVRLITAIQNLGLPHKFWDDWWNRRSSESGDRIRHHSGGTR